jgi:hypothetical protein
VFEAYPTPELRLELDRRGIRILGSFRETGLLVAADRPDWSGLPVRSAGPLEPARKLSPALRGYRGAAALVIFHPDVDAAAARESVEASGLAVLPNRHLLPGHVLATGNLGRLEALAALDSVAYVLPASVDLIADAPTMACQGGVTDGGLIAEYAKIGTGWPKADSGTVSLQYFFESFTDKITESVYRGEMERVFREWSRYAPITFSEAASDDAARTISVRFARLAHGDTYPFDGPGGVLGHTYYPAPLNAEPLAGDIHLDADEDWHAGTALDIYSVALHEAGHALGLGHSDQPGAVMYPYYRANTGLTADDIAGIQAIYGVISGTSTASSNPTALPPPSGPTAPTLPPPTEPSTPSQPPSNPTTPSTPPLPPPSAPGTPSTPVTPAPSTDTTAPSVTIVSPTTTILATSAASLVFSGRASDNVGVTGVRWSTSNGDTGTASGTTSWTATVPLYSGTNLVIIRADDAAGNSGWRSVTVVRR